VKCIALAWSLIANRGAGAQGSTVNRPGRDYVAVGNNGKEYK